jgi:thioredoxin 1
MKQGERQPIEQVDDARFAAEVLEAAGPVLVEFGAAWCPPCRALAPIVARVAADAAGRAKVVMVDIDDAPAVAKRYGIRSVPVVAVFRGGELVAQRTGLTTREVLLAMLDAPAPSP